MVVYNCIICNYETEHLSHYNKHKKSKRHLIKIENKTANCIICGKSYSSNSHMNRHLKKCKLINNQNNKYDEFVELKLENQKLNYELKIKETENNCKDEIIKEKDKCIEIIKDKNTITNNINSNNTITNQKINLNFLNQNYGHVITMDDYKKFIDQYKIPADIVEMIESAFSYNTLSAKSDSLLVYMKDVCKKNDIDMLPFICTDSNIRSHKEKTKDGWKVVINNDNIVYLIDSTFRSIAMQYPEKVIIAPPQERLEDLPRSIKKSLSSIKDIQVEIDNNNNRDNKMEKLKYYIEKLLKFLREKNETELINILTGIYIDHFINIKSFYNINTNDILTTEEFEDIMRYISLKDIDNLTIHKFGKAFNYKKENDKAIKYYEEEYEDD